MMDQEMLGLRILKGVCPLEQSQQRAKRQGRNTHQKMYHVLKLMPYIPGQAGEVVLMPPSEPSTSRHLEGA